MAPSHQIPPPEKEHPLPIGKEAGGLYHGTNVVIIIIIIIIII
jgi:hypothetical protein